MVATVQSVSSRPKRPPPVAAPVKERRPKSKPKRHTQPQKLSDGRTIQVATAKPAKPKVPEPGEREPLTERDPRTFSRMDPETKVIHTYLDQWGRECYDCFEGEASGYAPVTMLGRIIEQGPAAGSPGSTVSHLSELAKRIDVCVAGLHRRKHFLMFRCIKQYYIQRKPTEKIALKERESDRKIRRTLQKARELVGFLFFEIYGAGLTPA